MSNSCHNIRWAFNVNKWKPNKEQWKLALQCIQKEENERCNKFWFIEDCKSSLVGRLLMRKAVNEYCNLPYDKICFSRTESGKPFLKNEGKYFNFNVSHHGDFCVLAASSKEHKIGVDVMKIEHRGKRSVEDFFNTMKKQFSSYEWNFISQPGLELEQLGRFYRLWCLKESYVKAIGTGIACDLQKISFSCSTSILSINKITTDSKLYVDEKLQKNWIFEETLLDNCHSVAVAVEKSDISIDGVTDLEWEARNFSFLLFEDLLQNCKPFEIIEDNFWDCYKLKQEKKI